MGGLSRGELAILKRMRANLPNYEMLDLGVGAGRTTRAFASIAKSYVGVDFSPPMVDACVERFPGHDFRVADVRDLSSFADRHFDFILFSFNGVDCLAYEQRETVFREIHRVLRPGGFFAFSSHNASFLKPMPIADMVRLALRPGVSMRVALRKLAFMRKAVSVAPAADDTHAVVLEEQHGHRVPIVYVKPENQERDLSESGWAVVAAISNATGESVAERTDLLRAADAWIYYLCAKAEPTGRLKAPAASSLGA
jgi:SAM-dependent methyltransferase